MFGGSLWWALCKHSAVTRGERPAVLFVALSPSQAAWVTSGCSARGTVPELGWEGCPRALMLAPASSAAFIWRCVYIFCILPCLLTLLLWLYCHGVWRDMACLKYKASVSFGWGSTLPHSPHPGLRFAWHKIKHQWHSSKWGGRVLLKSNNLVWQLSGYSCLFPSVWTTAKPILMWLFILLSNHRPVAACNPASSKGVKPIPVSTEVTFLIKAQNS